MSRYVKATDREKLDANKLEVLTYQQELVIVQKTLELRDLTKVSEETQTKYTTVLQVATKYIDVISLIIQNTKMNELIEKSYSKMMKKVLDANEKAIDLLHRQVNLLWNEYNKPENSTAVLHDYLITQIMNIQEKLQKIIDKNDITYKSNKEYLLKQLGMNSKEIEEMDLGSHSDNAQSVYEKLKARDNAIMDSKRPSIATTPANSYSFDMYDKPENEGEEPKFLGHFNSCQHCADELDLSVKSIQKAMNLRFNRNEREFIYNHKYLVMNLKRGDELSKEA